MLTPGHLIIHNSPLPELVREQPPRDLQVRQVSKHLHRWRVGWTEPDDEIAKPQGVTHRLAPDDPLDYARDFLARRFLDRLDRAALAPIPPVHVWDAPFRHGDLAGTSLTVWCWAVQSRCPVLDPHPVDPTDTTVDLLTWAYRAARAVLDAEHARTRWASLCQPFAPPQPALTWRYAVHPDTWADLIRHDQAREVEYDRVVLAGGTGPGSLERPRPLLDHIYAGPDATPTIRGHHLEVTPLVEAGLLHAEQLLPVNP